jgi:hypothetical protein
VALTGGLTRTTLTMGAWMPWQLWRQPWGMCEGCVAVSAVSGVCLECVGWVTPTRGGGRVAGLWGRW